MPNVKIKNTTKIFGDLVRGDFFVYNNELFIKFAMSYEQDNAYNIGQEVLITLGSRAEVEKVPSERISIEVN